MANNSRPRKTVPKPTPGQRTDGRIAPFAKTKLCRFEVLGMCTKGLECPFAHGSDELKALPDLRCTKICKTLIDTGVCHEPGCTYAHNRDELRAPGLPRPTFKTKLCKYFAEGGHCNQGSWCQFAHSTSEKREALGQGKSKRNTRKQEQQQQQQQQTQQDTASGGTDSMSASSRDELAESITASFSLESAICADTLPPPPGLELPAPKDPASADPVYITIGESFKVDSPPRTFMQPGPTWLDIIDNVLGSSGSAAPAKTGSGAALNGVEYGFNNNLFATNSIWRWDQAGLSVDQQDGTVKISTLAPTQPASSFMKPIRSIRTSETTLCSLSDYQRQAGVPAFVGSSASSGGVTLG